MISSVSSESERELIDAGTFYAREGNVDLGLAFIAEFERTLEIGVIALAQQSRKPGYWRGRK